jgi:dihydroorotate dehydrogenase electron transfer subunit
MIDAVTVVERNHLTASASGRGYGLLRLRVPRKIEVLPGQFAMIKPHQAYEPLMRRAMAFYRSERAGDGVAVEFIYQILGRGTQSLARLKAGDEVAFLGPLGNTYELEAARDREALLVAGGAGSPALFLLAEELIQHGIPTRLYIGGASRGDLCGLDEFTALLGADNVIGATVDGSFGARGFVTQPLEAHLQSKGGRSRIIYACGPDPMLHRVALIAAEHDTPAQLSLESPMACGFGICVGCAVAVKADCPEGFVYKKVCTDGPVFWGHDLVWSAAA